jgi:O-antigen ligase
MELTVSADIRARLLEATRRLTSRFDSGAAASWTLAFALVAYLALRDGGYDTAVRSEVGVAVWWIVLLGALVGLLPARIGRAGWVAIALLAGFAVWTGAALGWTEDTESTMVELGRLSAYLGVLVLAISLQGRAGARHTINGLASAIGLITVLAVLSRLHPQAFPPNGHLQVLDASARKLSYPLNYWNGLAAFMAIGVPLLLAVAVGGRSLLGQAIAAATLPISVLGIYLTISRGGVIELGAGLAAFLVLTPRRIEAAATALVSAAGGVLLVWAVHSRPALGTGVPSAHAIQQGSRLVVLAAIVCAGVGLLQVALVLAARHYERPQRLRLSRPAAVRAVLAVATVVVVAAVAFVVPGHLEHAWQEFKKPIGAVVPHSEANVLDRLSAANGNSRYQFWQSAVHAMQTRPLTGIGPGTFQYWWAAHATQPGFIRNAHSLYLETLAETGIIGLALLGGLLLFLAALAVRRSFAAPPAAREWIAAAGAGLAAFLVATAFDWVWQLAAIAATALVLGAVIVAGRDETQTARWVAPRWNRLGAAGASIVAIGAIAVPLAGTLAIEHSQRAAAQGELGPAYQDALTAQRLEPYAASPRLQEALVLEAAGRLAPAAAAARAATENGPYDSYNWIVLARIEARLGATGQALTALRRAQTLNPRSTLVEQ